MTQQQIDLLAKLADCVLFPQNHTDTEKNKELAREVYSIAQKEWMKRQKLSKACRIYNEATNPWIPLSEFQHGIRRKISKKVRNYLRDHGQGKIKETDSGTLKLIA
jgi:hypothetical protein